jgi:hypothetical protein
VQWSGSPDCPLQEHPRLVIHSDVVTPVEAAEEVIEVLIRARIISV